MSASADPTDRTAADRTAAAFRAAVEAQDMGAAVALLADDVVFESPIVHRQYRGRDAVAPVLFAVGTVFEDFRYTATFSGGPISDGGSGPGGPSDSGHVLRFSARVDDRDLDGVDILTVDDEGRIVAFAVMVRPYSAATALRTRMAAMLAG